MPKTAEVKIPEAWGKPADFCNVCGVELRGRIPHYNAIDCIQTLRSKYEAIKDEFVKAWLWRQETYGRLERFKNIARALTTVKRLRKLDEKAVASAYAEIDKEMEILFPGGYPEGW